MYIKNIKRLSRKILFLLLSLFLFTGLAGCGKNPLNPKDPVTLTLWNYYGGEQSAVFNRLVSEFNETRGQKLGVIIDAYSKNNISDLFDALTASANHEPGAPPMPDIFSAYPDMAFELDKKDILAPLNEYFTKDELDEYVDSYIESGYFEGQKDLKLFPIAKSTEVLMLNKTDWDKFSASTGVSQESLKTWEGINEAAEKYYDYSGGKALIGRSSVANYIIVGAAQLGHPIVESKGGSPVIQLDEETFRRLWSCYYVPYVKGFYGTAGRSVNGDAKAGLVLMSVSSISKCGDFPSEITINDSETYPIESVCLPLPGFAGYDPYAIQQGAGMAVTRSTHKKEYAAVEFLKWFTEAERNIGFSIGSGYLPVKKSANSRTFIESYLNSYSDAINPIIRNTLQVAVNQNETYHLYSLSAFSHSTELRDFLEDSLTQKADADYKAVQGLIKTGISREDALSRFLTERSFMGWFSELQEAIARFQINE